MTGWKGVSAGVLAAAGITLGADGVVQIPYRRPDGSVLRWRFRQGSRAWWGPGEEISLLGLETLPLGSDPFRDCCAILVTEGESDCLAARQHLLDCCILGSPGAHSFRADWRIVLADFSLIYVVGDGDEAGRDFVWDVRRKVPWSRPITCGEGDDLRALLQRDGVGPVLKLLAEADWLARLDDALLHARDLAEAEAWLEPR